MKDIRLGIEGHRHLLGDAGGRGWRAGGGRVVQGCTRGYIEPFGKRGCCSVGGDRNSSLGGKSKQGGCGRWVMEEGGSSEMRAEAGVRKL